MPRLILNPTNLKEEPPDSDYSFIPLPPSLHAQEDVFLKSCQKRCSSGHKRRHTIGSTSPQLPNTLVNELLSSLMLPFRMSGGEDEAQQPQESRHQQHYEGHQRPPNAVSFDDARTTSVQEERTTSQSGIDVQFPESASLERRDEERSSAFATSEIVETYPQETLEQQGQQQQQPEYEQESPMPMRVLPAASAARAASAPSESIQPYEQGTPRHHRPRSHQEVMHTPSSHYNPYQYPSQHHYGYQRQHRQQSHHYYDYSGYYHHEGEHEPSSFHPPPPWPSTDGFHNYSPSYQDYSHSYYSASPHTYPTQHFFPQDPYASAAQHDRHPHSAPPSYHRGYARSTPPGERQDHRHFKETPSAITEGTTPSKQSPPLDLSPEILASFGDSSEDERKPAARTTTESDDRSNQREVREEVTTQDDFEPIPFWNQPPSNVIGSQGEEYAYPVAASAASASAQEPFHGYAVDPSHAGLPPRPYTPSRSTNPMQGNEGSSWEKRFAELLEFRSRHGHCEVPQNYKENTSLGIWVNKQRMEQKLRMEGKNSSLNDVRLRRLESVGFRWAKRKGQVSWNEKFEELRAYKRKHGNCHVPTKYKENTALGRWVSTQRAEYKKYCEGEKTNMTAEKIRRLEEIGFAWFMAL